MLKITNKTTVFSYKGVIGTGFTLLPPIRKPDKIHKTTVFRDWKPAVQIIIPERRETSEAGPMIAVYCLERISRQQYREGKPTQSLEVSARLKKVSSEFGEAEMVIIL